MKLVPRQWIDGHKVVFGNRLHVGTDAHRTAAAQDQHGMSVLMLLERRIAAGRNLKITQLACVVRLGEQDLPSDVLERRAALGLVLKAIDVLPAEVAGSIDQKSADRLMRSRLPPLRLRR